MHSPDIPRKAMQGLPAPSPKKGRGVWKKTVKSVRKMVVTFCSTGKKKLREKPQPAAVERGGRAGEERKKGTRKGEKTHLGRQSGGTHTSKKPKKKGKKKGVLERKGRESSPEKKRGLMGGFAIGGGVGFLVLGGGGEFFGGWLGGGGLVFWVWGQFFFFWV